MLRQYYDTAHDARVWEWVAPEYVVALDIDAPNDTFSKGQKNYHYMVEKVILLANQLAEMFGLGHWWAYDTGSPGVHVIFEKPAENAMAWKDALYAASTLYGFKECAGHRSTCISYGRCKLRVGLKGDRPWDIVPWFDNPVPKPDHVREHDEALREQRPAASGR